MEHTESANWDVELTHDLRISLDRAIFKKLLQIHY